MIQIFFLMNLHGLNFLCLFFNDLIFDFMYMFIDLNDGAKLVWIWWCSWRWLCKSLSLSKRHASFWKFIFHFFISFLFCYSFPPSRAISPFVLPPFETRSTVHMLQKEIDRTVCITGKNPLVGVAFFVSSRATKALRIAPHAKSAFLRWF